MSSKGGLNIRQFNPPSFEILSSLEELFYFPNNNIIYRFNFFAVSEIYEAIKFSCSICGMRFIRNLTLK
jgi:hypothetical protein